MRAVDPTVADDLKKLITGNAAPKTIESAMAQANVETSRRSTTISSQCVTGHLLPSGEAEITPHGMRDDVEYMPGFVKRSLTFAGIRGFNVKYSDGRPLPPVWVGMTARVQGTGKAAVTATINAFRNIEAQPVTADAPPATGLVWMVTP
jgi:hypothetical protein